MAEWEQEKAKTLTEHWWEFLKWECDPKGIDIFSLMVMWEECWQLLSEGHSIFNFKVFFISFEPRIF